MVRIEVKAAADTLGEAVATFEAAHRGLRRAIARRDQVERRVEQMILQATGGLELRRLEQVRRHRRIHTTADARMLASAIRVQNGVQAAVAKADRFRALEAASVRAARDSLADAAKHLLLCGQLAVDCTGLSEPEVRLLARRPTGPRQSLRSHSGRSSLGQR
jgi:hypothetical protein